MSIHSIQLPNDPAYNGKVAIRNTDRTLKVLSNNGLCDGWWTVQMIAKLIGSTETSASSALRDLRKPQYGSYNIVRRRLTNGLSEYRLYLAGESPDTKGTVVG